MVARGDMGVEIPAEEVPHVQKEIIKKCKMCIRDRGRSVSKEKQGWCQN